MGFTYIGGYVFIGSSAARSQSDLIALALTTLGDSGRIFSVRLSYPGIMPSLPSIEAELAHLQSVGEGRVELDMAGMIGVLKFEADTRLGYRYIGVMLADRAFIGEKVDARNILDFRRRWLTFCEASGAEFGYFGEYEREDEEAFRHDEVVIPLLLSEVDDLLKQDFWLTYLSAGLLEIWGKMQVQPSGAITVFAGRGENPVTGEDLPDVADTDTMQVEQTIANTN